MDRVRVYLFLTLVLVFASGCSKHSLPRSDGQSRSKTVTLVVWDWHAADPSKGIGKWLADIDREFERLHPNVTIKHVAQSHSEYYQILKAAASASSHKHGPDVVALHQGNRILDMRNNLRPLTEYITPEFKRQIIGWELTSENYDKDGTPWAVPITVQSNVWYYNKPILREAGLDPNRPPATWKEFLAACDAVKRKGKAGIAAGEKERAWAGFFVGSAAFQTLSPADISRLRSGTMRWTDPRLTEILARLKELNDRGCFQKGAMSTPQFPDAGEIFMRGDAAFFLGLISDTQQWKELGDMLGPANLGVMRCPVFKPGPDADRLPIGTVAYAITKWSAHPDLAFQYISFMANRKNAITLLSEAGAFPANQEYDRKAIEDPCAREISSWLSSGRTSPAVYALIPMSVDEALSRQCQRLLSGQTDVTGALRAVEKAAASARSREGGTTGETRR